MRLRRIVADSRERQARKAWSSPRRADHQAVRELGREMAVGGEAQMPEALLVEALEVIQRRAGLGRVVAGHEGQPRHEAQVGDPVIDIFPERVEVMRGRVDLRKIIPCGAAVEDAEGDEAVNHLVVGLAARPRRTGLPYLVEPLARGLGERDVSIAADEAVEPDEPLGGQALTADRVLPLLDAEQVEELAGLQERGVLRRDLLPIGSGPGWLAPGRMGRGRPPMIGQFDFEFSGLGEQRADSEVGPRAAGKRT